MPIRFCNSTDQSKRKFKRNSHWLSSLCVFEKNEVIIPLENDQALNIHKEDGKLRSMKVQDDHMGRSVAFHRIAFSVSLK